MLWLEMQTGLVPAQSLEPAKDSRTDKASRHMLAPKKELTVRREDAFITFFPENTQRLTYGIDESREAAIIGKQWFSWAPSEDQHYRWGIAPARTYAPSLQVCLLFPSICLCSFLPDTHAVQLQVHLLHPSRCVLFAFGFVRFFFLFPFGESFSPDRHGRLVDYCCSITSRPFAGPLLVMNSNSHICTPGSVYPVCGPSIHAFHAAFA